MINAVLNFYDNSLLYNPNSTFFLFIIIFSLFLLLLLSFLGHFVQLMRGVITDLRQIPAIRSRKKRSYTKLLIKQISLRGREIFNRIDIIEQKIMKGIYAIANAVGNEIFIPKKERER